MDGVTGIKCTNSLVCDELLCSCACVAVTVDPERDLAAARALQQLFQVSQCPLYLGR